MERSIRVSWGVSGASTLAVLALCLPTSALAQTAAPKVTSARADVSFGEPLALTFYLRPKHRAEAEAEAVAIQTPGDARYHQFLTRGQFVSKYAPSEAELANTEASLVNLGFTISSVFPNHLAIEVTANAGTAEAVLGAQLKRFTIKDRSGMASVTPVKVPSILTDWVEGIGGLDTMTHARPRHKTFAAANQKPHALPALIRGGSPGNYLPADFASFYHVKPLYDVGINGRGSTIGIVTLNDFDPADAYSFWKASGLKVSQTRITKVDVDGGLTASTNNPDGESETDLDVEQSGSLAPGAKVRVYIAPNITNANFVNGFEAAASENIADTVSTSWGQPELDFFYNVAAQAAGDTFLLRVFHDVFLEMALQGQTVYVAAGDSGAFDTVSGCLPFGTPSTKNPVCNAPYSVDHPSSDPLVTAAGGTTLPFAYSLTDGVLLSVAKEQAWGWDYIAFEAAAQGHGADITLEDVFSVGGGGGVSSFWKLPVYQASTPGTTLTKPGQKFIADFGTGPQVQNVLRSDFSGRNMPDLSANADPQSGYYLVEEGLLYNFYGGTSFVAPQLNGVTALYVEALGQRVGQINPALYEFGESASTNIKAGDNWGYLAAGKYDNASGLGTLNAEKLLIGLLFNRFQ